MGKNDFAKTPPMGWNSYDYYDTTVTEKDVKANADYMAEHLKEHGWEYIVVDIEWYAHNAGSRREEHQYIPFEGVEMDEYSRLLPDPARFPSAAEGKGFKPLADYIHAKGLKFGIHIMRGIPRIAAHTHTKIKGTEVTADRIANPYSISRWNPDMYGVDASQKGAQEYYDSIFELYAQWGVDFVKCDDICNTNMYPDNPYSAREEVEMLHRAITKTGREIVLSLSPGPALIEQAWHYETYANMWRITDDFWDKWELLLNMFERCELWQKHVSKGCFPDCDMLPLGYLGKGFGREWYTNFTKEEQTTMLTLWCIFRSPLMLGCELTKLDEWTTKLITNDKVLGLLKHSKGARQLERDASHAVWISQDTEVEAVYIALFNFEEESRRLGLELDTVEVESEESCSLSAKLANGFAAEELWSGQKFTAKKRVEIEVSAHGAVLLKLE